MNLTLEDCRAPGVEAHELNGKTVYLRRPNGLQAIRYQDAVTALKLDEIENSSEQGLLFTACVVKHFVMDPQGKPLFAELTEHQMAEQLDMTLLDDLYGLVQDNYMQPVTVEDAAKNS